MKKKRREPRSYDMRKRAHAAEQTRLAILEAAHALLNRSDGSALTLQEVAAEAGVSRATIYKSIGSRRELLASVFEDQGRLIGYERVRAAGALADPAAALIETVRESCRAWSIMPDAIRKTLALAVIDPEIGEVVSQYDRYRREEMTALARRAHDAMALHGGTSVEHAAMILGLLTSFAAFDQLRAAVGSQAACDHLERSARVALGVEPAMEER